MSCKTFQPRTPRSWKLIWPPYTKSKHTSGGPNSSLSEFCLFNINFGNGSSSESSRTKSVNLCSGLERKSKNIDFQSTILAKMLCNVCQGIIVALLITKSLCSTSQDSIAILLQIRESLFVLNINILITELRKLHLMDLQWSVQTVHISYNAVQILY